MFNRISTKDLCLVQLRILEREEWKSLDTYISRYSNQKRFTIAKKLNDYGEGKYKDIFTHTIYRSRRNILNIGEEFVYTEKNIITDKKYITREEATCILQNLNPNYLPEKPLIRQIKK